MNKQPSLVVEGCVESFLVLHGWISEIMIGFRMKTRKVETLKLMQLEMIVMSTNGNAK